MPWPPQVFRVVVGHGRGLGLAVSQFIEKWLAAGAGRIESPSKEMATSNVNE